MIEARRGDRIPKDGTITKKVTVEVGAEVGLMVNVELDYKDGEPINLESEVTEKVVDILEIDGEDKVLNDIIVYGIQ